jgi:hypothetical protein
MWSAVLAFVQPAEQVEDEGGLGYGLIDIAQLVGSGLVAEAVLVDRGISLGHGIEFMT